MIEGLTIVAVIFIIALIVAMTRQDGGELDSYYDSSDGECYEHKWGYTDTRFEFDGPRTVRVTGDRYRLCGFTMPYFVPFVEEVLGVPITPEEMVEEVERQRLPEAKLDNAFRSAIDKCFGRERIGSSDGERLVHSHGQLSVDEIYRLLYIGGLQKVVDVVIYPESEKDVRDLVELATEHEVVLIPYGGGTNVSGALACPTAETRTIASVDMRRLNRIEAVDEENLQATAQAGITGKELERELGALGYTSGHDPDSVELSTLGGWISTNASGMKKNRYGNSEDIVLEATLVTPSGDVKTHRASPRNSTGVQPRALLFGSEGNFGIITKGTIKIHKLPEVRQYGALAFPRFEQGVAFLKQLSADGGLPASIRLVNNTEFRFGQALKPSPSPFKAVIDRVQKFILFKLKGFTPEEICGCTIVMEGTRREVENQKEVIFELAKDHGGLSVGAKLGQRGYMLTFGIAYIRDFFNQFQLLGETFETSVPWNRIHDVIGAVREKLVEQTAHHQVRGTPYLAYRVTQVYHTGVCIYFTMGFSGKGLDKADEVYHDVEHSLRQVILDHGGSLSHHHGIGKVRHSFLSQIQSQGAIEVIRQAKGAMDPKNIFAIGNGVFAEGN
ncbi:MAG: FAD-binding oxidoreductase [Candidatus Latescibacterota bacterium]|nr:FAD-binding oxidoreductase [Candidatus Latescibacterota bacterium]